MLHTTVTGKMVIVADSSELVVSPLAASKYNFLRNLEFLQFPFLQDFLTINRFASLCVVYHIYGGEIMFRPLLEIFNMCVAKCTYKYHLVFDGV